jgi:Flp pilus assembly protein TadD
MLRAVRRPLYHSLLGATLLITLTSCRQDKPVPVEELFTTRTLAMSHLQRGQLPEAEVQFKKLIELAPDDPLGYANLGLTYLQEGRFPDAERELLRARKLDPRNADVALTLAKLYALTKRPSDAQQILDDLRRADPRNAHALYALAELDAQSADSAAARRRQGRLRELLTLSPANLAVRLDLLDLFASQGQADSAVRQLEEVRRIPPEPPKEARADLDLAIQLLRAGKLAETRAPLDRLLEAMRLTSPYQTSLAAVKWVEGPIVGTPVLTYAPTELISTRGLHRTAPADSVRFVDATDESGLLEPRSGAAPAPATNAVAIAVGDVRGDGRDNLLVSSWSAERKSYVVRLFAIQRGFATDVTARSGISIPGGASFATFADVDNDGWLDLFAIGVDGRGHLLRNKGDGTFEDVTAKAGVADVRSARKALFVDLDHDGDLDLLLVGGAQRTVYRNDSKGTFTDATAAFGLGGGAAYDAAFGDFDGDGRIDLVMTGVGPNGGVALFHNGGAQRFSDVTAASGLLSGDASGVVAVGDYDNDGHLDIFVASRTGGEPALWRNTGDGTFVRDAKAGEAIRAVRGAAVQSAELADYDNDGWLDLLAIGKPTAPSGRGAFLLHNEGNGRFTDRSAILPHSITAGTALAVTDVDEDGDEDLIIADTTGAVHLLRNDGGNARMAVRVQLKGLRTGSGKNNDFGVGARLEMRAGELYQTRVATGRVTHFGLGPHLKADVLRVEWPNGVPQTVFFPGTDQDVVELETLKGSCAFAYTWDGERFRFVTDVMWRSALGMPLGLMAGGASTAFAPAGASQEYLRIPGDALRPKDGRYLLQLTEELWETAYADEVKLLAVDHPDSVEVFVDERFVPPGPVSMRLYQVARKQLPRSAIDERGADLRPALRETDDVYVSNLTPTRYQGVVEPHDLVMDLGDDAGRPGSYLFLRGWIYPTDASINVALSQQSALKLAPPSLEVRDARGEWKTVVASLGFPSGKNKTMVIDLAGRFPTRDHTVRIRTNMQIYWDQAFVAGDAEQSPVKVTTLAPVHADLHARGYSRMYRKGGRYGPYWFAYDDLTTTSPWRAIEGTFTRFGDVRPLLDRADDMYVVMAPGDETTLQFDASSASAIPKGWTRDFLLYTDGWIKDSDLNTAFGTTVAPLPFHRIKSYPYAPGESYPGDAEHRRYLREYNTRSTRR